MFHTKQIYSNVCQQNADSPYKDLGHPGRIWAISAIHGRVDKLTALHDVIMGQIRLGDRLVYLGNYTGYNDNAAACIDEILMFRRLALSIPGMKCSDIVYLRGRQEEMWHKLLQIQFAPDPAGVLLWMLGNGLSASLQSYGISPHDGIEACRAGIMSLTKWTNAVRETLRRHKGHDIFAMHLARAAHTAVNSDYPLLFVHAGLDARKPLSDQNDSLWWADAEFAKMSAPYLPFQKVVRGYDPARGGLKLNCVTATLDAGCGFGGPLICAEFDLKEQSVEILEI